MGLVLVDLLCIGYRNSVSFAHKEFKNVTIKDLEKHIKYPPK